jgi:hypothetical protein
LANELNISGVSPILLQHIKKWRLYRETDRDAIYTIELAVVYHFRSIIFTFKDVSAVTIRDLETLKDCLMCFSVLNRRRKASTLWKNGRSRRSAFIAGNMRWWKGEDRVFEKLRKRQQELEETPYPDELYGFEAEIYEFFMLIAGSLDYVLANKRLPRHQRHSLERSFFELYPDIPRI